jgi:hypothetical protein
MLLLVQYCSEVEIRYMHGTEQDAIKFAEQRLNKFGHHVRCIDKSHSDYAKLRLQSPKKSEVAIYFLGTLDMAEEWINDTLLEFGIDNMFID